MGFLVTKWTDILEAVFSHEVPDLY